MQPGHQPHNRIGTEAEQLRRAATPKRRPKPTDPAFMADVAASRAELLQLIEQLQRRVSRLESRS